jgi:hypothetical protein
MVSDASNATGAYSLYFARAPGGGETLSLGVNRIDRGDLDTSRFVVEQGMTREFVVGVPEPADLLPIFTLYDPSGTPIEERVGELGFHVSSADLALGAYTIMISGVGASAGNYVIGTAATPAHHPQLNVYDFEASSIDVGVIINYATFQSTVGARVFVNVAGVDGSSFAPRMSIYGPTGERFAQGSGEGLVRMSTVIEETGWHSLMLSGLENTHGAFELNIATVPGADELGLLSDGATRLSAITLGDIDTFTFTATAGRTARVVVTDTNGTLSPVVSVYRSTTLVYEVADTQTLAFDVPITTSGVHTLVITDQADGVGQYSVTVSGANPPATPAPVPSAPAWTLALLAALLAWLGFTRLQRPRARLRRSA